MFLDILFNEDDNFVIGGQQGITDTKGAGPEHVLPLLPKLLTLAQEIIDSKKLEQATKVLEGKTNGVVQNKEVADSEIKIDEKTKTSLEEATKEADQMIGDKLTAKEKQQLFLRGTLLAPKILPLLRKADMLLNEGLPSRAQRWDFINPPLMWQMPYQIIKPHFPERYVKKIFIHDKEEELYKIVPRSYLPKEYGGEAGTVDEIKDYWKKKIESYKDWFLEDEQYRCDESKRPEKLKSHLVEDGTFGTEGTFRNLSVE
ncbi:hypothetical protein ILUMI_26657 [Ignelater luminosus]|uniref:CRAL-TRIO domain-containing protein n=1 Tax=Ignelater luminosus TaxID=2038154 RepID=A0A8K0C3L1_IGNLU|nr:hypothetical protein ILUMI_26657 [Ignelater luminosus]